MNSVKLAIAVCIVCRAVFFAMARSWTPEYLSNLNNIPPGSSDPAAYHQLALSIIERCFFGYSPSQPSPIWAEKNEPEALILPLYPLLIGIVYSIFGVAPEIVIILQILLDAFSCYILYAIISRAFNEKTAVISSYFYAIDPNIILHTNGLFTESLFMLFLLSGMHFFVKAIQSNEKTYIYFAISSFVWGLATLVRPVIYYFLPFLLLFMFLVFFKKRLVKGLNAVLIILIVFAIAVSPWCLRNYYVFGHYSLSSSGGYNLLGGTIASMKAIEMGVSTSEAKNILLNELNRRMTHKQKNNPFSRAEQCREIAIEEIKKSPASFLKAQLIGAVRLYASLGTSLYFLTLNIPYVQMDAPSYGSFLELLKDFLSQRKGFSLFFSAMLALHLLVIYVFFAMGAFISWQQHDWRYITLFLIFIVYLTAISAGFSHARLRIPISPFYFCFASIGFTYLVTMRKNLFNCKINQRLWQK